MSEIPQDLVMLTFGKISAAAVAFNTVRARAQQLGRNFVCLIPPGDTNSIVIEREGFAAVIGTAKHVDDVLVNGDFAEIPPRFIPVEL